MSSKKAYTIVAKKNWQYSPKPRSILIDHLIEFSYLPILILAQWWTFLHMQLLGVTLNYP